jgi:hypothetical protein
MEAEWERWAPDCELRSSVAGVLEGHGGVFRGHEGLKAFRHELGKAFRCASHKMGTVISMPLLRPPTAEAPGHQREPASAANLLGLESKVLETTREGSSGHMRSATSAKPSWSPRGESHPTSLNAEDSDPTQVDPVGRGKPFSTRQPPVLLGAKSKLGPDDVHASRVGEAGLSLRPAEAGVRGSRVSTLGRRPTRKSRTAACSSETYLGPGSCSHRGSAPCFWRGP